MKIICNAEEAKILIRNCKHEQCDFCFLSEICRDNECRNTISSLIEVKNTEQPEGGHDV